MKYRERLPWSSDGNDLWVFAYGSLMWNPAFDHLDARDGRLLGYHRKLCIYSTAYRGTTEQPGLVFGLDAGGSCRGRVLLVAADEVDRTIEYLYRREMVTNVYVPIMGQVRISGLRTRRALAFVADSRHEQYAGSLPDDEVVRLVLQGRGPAGTCMDYVRATVEHLSRLGVRDRHLERLVAHAVAARSPTPPEKH